MVYTQACIYVHTHICMFVLEQIVKRNIFLQCIVSMCYVGKDYDVKYNKKCYKSNLK